MTPRFKFVSFDEKIHSVDELRYWEGGDTEYKEWINLQDECEEIRCQKEMVKDGDDLII